ncbi:hypothetical protein [Erythrobacter donghaensis]|uniref:hypothetical protein n=1 Tax=Erythrobacter donghaensis TaxID=267135 RepID=UPI0012D8ABDF|nr:hypothetical protein [Erythrobacter donghaensis]
MESTVRTSDLIILKMYMKYGDRVPGRSLSLFNNSVLLHRALILRAQEAGLVSAMLGQSTYGFVQDGDMAYELCELINPSRVVWVELQDSEDNLQQFCIKNAELLYEVPIYSQSIQSWVIEKFKTNK